MSRRRFEELQSHLQFADPKKSPNNWSQDTSQEKQHYNRYVAKHPLFEVQPIWDAVQKCCQDNFNLAREVAFEEAMVGYKGAKGHLRRIYCPSKPKKVGFKIYALSDSITGYLHSFDWMKKWKDMVELVCAFMRPLQGRHHQVFTDRAYTSVRASACNVPKARLARTLLSQSTYITGSIKLNAKGIPREFSSTQSKNPNIQRVRKLNLCARGTQYYRQNGSLTHVLWKDSKICSIVSTCHNAYRNKSRDFVQRKFIKPGDRSAGSHNVPTPPSCINYNAHYGGVDRHDQLRSYFTVDRKTNKWYLHILWFLVDVAAANALICHRFGKEKRDQISHSKFIMDVAEGLISGYVEQGRFTVQNTNVVTLPPTSTHHSLVHMRAKHSKACVGCLQLGRKSKGGKGKREPRTVYGCQVCRKHYCHECYLRYIHFAIQFLTLTLTGICNECTITM